MSAFDFFAAAENTNFSTLKQRFHNGQLDPYHFLLLFHARQCWGEKCAAGKKKEPPAKEEYRRIVHQRDSANQNNIFSQGVLSESLELMRGLGLLNVEPGHFPAGLPRGSALLKFDFKLKQPFLSRDDAAFYPIDNPVRKDRVFKAPFISGASWKGSLRAAAVESLRLRVYEPDGLTPRPVDEDLEESLIRERLNLIDLFGDEKGAADSVEEDSRESLAAYLDSWFKELGIYKRFAGERQKLFHVAGPVREFHKKGRVQVRTSFFDAIDVDLINPRDRVTRAGTVPIELELVPKNSSARFSLLYVPFDLLWGPDDLVERVRRDWQLLGEALVRMLRYTGFGAKKSSGCGTACSEITGFSFESALEGFQPAEIPSVERLAGLHNCFGARS